jgi:hypothetical protein
MAMMGPLEPNWIFMKRHLCALAIALLLSSCQSPEDSASAQAPAAEPTPPKALHWPDQPQLPVPGTEISADQKAALDIYRDLELGVVSEIMAGTSHRINGTMNTIEFKRVLRDSRCPTGTECAGNGQLEVEVQMTFEGKSETLKLSGTPVVWKDVTLVLRDVLPHPSPEPHLSLPRLQVIIDKATVKYTHSIIPGVRQEAPNQLDLKQIQEALEKAKTKPPEANRVITPDASQAQTAPTNAPVSPAP